MPPLVRGGICKFESFKIDFRSEPNFFRWGNMVIQPRPFLPWENSGFRELSFPMAVFNKFGINSLAESIRRAILIVQQHFGEI